MRAAAGQCHADEHGHPPAHTVIAKVSMPRGPHVGVACLDAKPEREA